MLVVIVTVTCLQEETRMPRSRRQFISHRVCHQLVWLPCKRRVCHRLMWLLCQRRGLDLQTTFRWFVSSVDILSVCLSVWLSVCLSVCVCMYHTISFHLDCRGLDCHDNAEANSLVAHCTMCVPWWNEKGGWGVYPSINDALQPLCCWQCLCVVCAGEEEGRLKGFVPIILRARPVRWVYLRPCTVYIAGLICYGNTGLQ